MEPQSNEQLICSNCGSELQPEHRFCPQCGTAVTREEPKESSSTQEFGYEGLFEDPTTDQQSVPPEPAQEPDPSILETREHRTYDFQASPYPEQDLPGPPPPAYQDTGDPTWGTAETTVPPERGNRTLWIILGIIAFIVLICCCILPLALMIIANVDTTFQNEIRSSSATLPALL